MSQLPEVEVIRKDLEREIVGKRFKDITVKTASIVARHRNRPEFVKALQGRKIEGILRRGVWLLLELDDGSAMAIRLGPQGTLTRETANEEPGRHTQLVATFTTGGALHYVDPAKAGEVFVAEPGEINSLRELTPPGIDPIADTYTWQSFSDQLRRRDTSLKLALCDESFLIGLGDLYSDEILWAAGLSGRRNSATLSSQEVRRLYRAVQEVLHEAVKQGGTSEGGEGEHVDLFGEKGEFGESLKVFGREAEPCFRCRQPIRHGEIESKVRSFYCAQCQT